MSISSVSAWRRPEYEPSEFGTGKRSNRGTAQAEAIVTTVHNFLIDLWHNLGQE